jgi:hypothetical protein
MKRLLQLALFLVLAQELQSKEEAQVWEAPVSGGIESAVSLSPTAFSIDLVLSMSREFLATNRRRTLLRYLVVTDTAEAKNSLRGLGITDLGFPNVATSLSGKPK